MIRPLLFLVTPPLLLLAACGGGATKAPATSAAGAGPASTSTPPVSPAGLPTPKPAVETDKALTVAARGKTFDPTVADFRALPQTEIDTPQGKKTGVLLSSLAAKVETVATDLVTIEGRPVNQSLGGFVRAPLKDLASTTVFFVNDRGLVALASSSLPVEQWLSYVVTISISK